MGVHAHRCFLSMIVTDKEKNDTYQTTEHSSQSSALYQMKRVLDKGFRIKYHAIGLTKIESERLLAHKVGGTYGKEI